MDDALFSGSNEIEQIFSDDQFPCPVPLYAEQLQNLLANTHFSPLPSPATAEGSTVRTVHLPYGNMHTPTTSTTGTVDFGGTSNPGPCQSLWNSSLTPETHAPVAQLQNQYPGLLCGWTSALEPSTVLPSITSIPQSMPPTLAPINSGVGQYDPWIRWHLSGGDVDSCASSPDGDSTFSDSGFLRGFADYDFPSNAHADPQPSIVPTMSSIQFTALPCSKPICGPNRQDRSFECQWVVNRAPCDMRVTADRRSVIKHLQRTHGIKTGGDKVRQTCLWKGCKTTLNKESLARHLLAVHLREGVYCAECGLHLAREDSLKRHLRKGQHKAPSGKGAARQPSRNNGGF